MILNRNEVFTNENIKAENDYIFMRSMNESRQ